MQNHNHQDFLPEARRTTDFGRHLFNDEFIGTPIESENVEQTEVRTLILHLDYKQIDPVTGKVVEGDPRPLNVQNLIRSKEARKERLGRRL